MSRLVFNIHRSNVLAASVCQWVSESVTQTSWTLYRSQLSTDLHQNCHQGKSFRRILWAPVVIGGNSQYPCPSNRKWNKFLLLLVRKNSFNVKYLENGKRYDVRLKGGQIGNKPWAFNWTLTPDDLESLCSRTLKISHHVFRKRWQIYNDGVIESRIGNDP